MQEARRFPARIRDGFSAEQAEGLLGVDGDIDYGMSCHLRATALASLVTALPVVFVLWAFGVSVPGMWGALAFVGGVVPYVGSLAALALPALLTSLELEPFSRPIAVLFLLLLTQFVINNCVEPSLTARAADMSPLAVLVALAFWDLC